MPRQRSTDPDRPLAVLFGYLQLVWPDNRVLIAGILAVRVVRGMVPIAVAWVTKLVLDAIWRSATGGDTAQVLPLLVIEGALIIGNDLLLRASSLLELRFSERASIALSIRLMRQAASLTLSDIEGADVQDQIARARQQASGRTGLVGEALTLLQDVVTLTVFLAALAAYAPFMILLLTVATVPLIVNERRFAAHGYELASGQIRARRAVDYLREALTTSAVAKEVRLLQMQEWILGRFARRAIALSQQTISLASRRSALNSVFSMLSIVAQYVGYGLLVLDASQGTLQVGTLVFLGAAFTRARDGIQRLGRSVTSLYEQSLYLRDLMRFLRRPTVVAASPEIVVGRSEPPEIRFEDVGFRYPGAEGWAVRHVTFAVPAGQSLALVGENGAGKSTIGKLLVGLYAPIEGRIVVNGRPLDSLDRRDWWRQCAMISQDFARFAMTLRENVGTGALDALGAYLDAVEARSTSPKDDRTNRHRDGTLSHGNVWTEEAQDAARIQRATVRAHADAVAARLTGGYDQLLSRQLADGVDLSGGEWQRVALARAYVRDASCVVLDEPTAALDARAEAQVFESFREAMRGATSLLISHRLASVRLTDALVVLKQGEVVQYGRHEELLARPGLYQELYFLQARGYQVA